MDYDGEEDVALEDVLNALLVRLLDPLLHNLNPAAKLLYKQEDIAYQMEALAWLYNHFIRQTFPHLPFLDSPSLCRKAVIQRANLAGYLSLQNGGQTLTELRVSEACDAAGLQTSPKAKDRSCRVSRIAAVILSPCRKQCVLVQSLVTKSVWSFVEEDIGHGRKVRNKEDNRYELSAEFMKKNNKVANSKKLNSTEDELTDAALMKLVLLAVEDQTGIERAALKVEDEYLEAQCMSQGTASTRLYILVCSSLYDIKVAPHLEKATWVAIDEVLSRAAGPLVEASGWGVYPASAIDYFHLRPFCALLQNKLSQKQDEKLFLDKSSFGNGSCSKLQNHVTNGLESGSKQVQPKEKSVEDPSCTIIILEDQDTDYTGKEDSPGRLRATKGERKGSNQTTLTYNGSSATASTSEDCIEPKARPQDYNTKGRKKFRKVVESRNAGKESPKKVVISVGSGSECMQDGQDDNEGSRGIDRLQDNSPGHATNPWKGKQDNEATAANVEQSANSSLQLDVEGVMMTKAVENNKDESKGVQGLKLSGGPCPEVLYIRPKMQGRSSVKASTSIIKEIEKKSQESETRDHQNGQIVPSDIVMPPKKTERSVQEGNGGNLKHLATVNNLLEVNMRGDKAVAVVDSKDVSGRSQEMDANQHGKDDIQDLREKRRRSLKRLLELTLEYQSQSEALLKDIADYDTAIQIILQETI